MATEAPWAAQHDRGVGFGEATKLLAQLAAECETAGKALAAPTAASNCGVDVEDKLRGYVSAQTKFYRDMLAWLEKNKARLTPAMAAKSLWNACDGLGALCDSKPQNYTDNMSPMQRLNAVVCVESEIDCSPPPGNVCKMPKVIERVRGGGALKAR